MQRTKKNISYVGKEVYAGMDVHKKTYSVTVICEGEIVKRDTMRADPEVVVRYLLNHFEGAKIHSVYEAGFCGFSLHRKLVAAGIDNIVINPASIEVAANDKVKTDKRDSKKQAEQLFRGSLSGIHIPTEAEESARVLTRTREQIVTQRARVATQIKSKLHYFGLMAFDDSRAVTESYLKELEEKELSEELSYGLRLFSAQWRFLTEQVKEIEAKLGAQARKDESEKVYRSVPGMGPISARVLSNELGNLRRFSNERRLFRFTGLTPGEYSSGGRGGQGGILKTAGGAGERWPGSSKQYGQPTRPERKRRARNATRATTSPQKLSRPEAGAQTLSCRHGSGSEGAGGEPEPWPRAHAAVSFFSLSRVAGPRPQGDGSRRVARQEDSRGGARRLTADRLAGVLPLGQPPGQALTRSRSDQFHQRK